MGIRSAPGWAIIGPTEKIGRENSFNANLVRLETQDDDETLSQLVEKFSKTESLENNGGIFQEGFWSLPNRTFLETAASSSAEQSDSCRPQIATVGEVSTMTSNYVRQLRVSFSALH